MMNRQEKSARAAWLYFERGYTQDEIASHMSISRAAAQRLISKAVEEKLITVKVEHPIVSCMALGAAVADHFGLQFCDVAQSDPKAKLALDVIAPALADRLLNIASATEPVTIAVGTGRTLRAAVDQMERLERPQHRVVSLVGTTSSNGRASFFDVAVHLADKIGADRYLMQLPVLAETPEIRETLQHQTAYAELCRLRDNANAVITGIGEIGPTAPLLQDGFITREELEMLVESGAVGEITGRVFDKSGQMIDSAFNSRVTSLTLPKTGLRIIAGAGAGKLHAIKAALTGQIANALITDETTASLLLAR